MTAQPPPHTEQTGTVTAVADPEQLQRAAEANAALVLLLCLGLVVLGTQALVALLAALA